MTRLLLVLFLFLMASSSAAERVAVYSGEHAEFSRVVLVFGEEIEWAKRETSGGYELQFNRDNLSIDTGSVFSKIPKERLQEIRYDEHGSRLYLTVSSKVGLDDFLLDDKTLVLDFKNFNAEGSTEIPENALASLTAFPLGRPDRLVSAPPFHIADPSNRPIGSGRVGFSPSDERGATHLIYDELLVEVEISSELEIKGVGTSDQEGRINRQISEPGSGRMHKGSLHLSVHPGWGSEMPEPSMQGMAQDNILECFGQEQLDIASWSSDTSPEMAISEARSFPRAGLDELSDSDVENLIRTYIYLGLGVEAIAILKEFDSVIEGREVYLQISSIIDELERDDPSLFQGLGECDGPSALWAALAAGNDGRDEKFDFNSIQNWFMKLPTHLRDLLGPRLAEFLWQHGEIVRFDAVHAATERVGSENSLDWWIVEGRRKSRSGDHSASSAIFKESLPTSDDRTMIVMAEVLKTNDLLGAHNKHDLRLGEAVLFEGKMTEPPGDLLQELALGWFAVGDYSAAWDSWHRAELYSVSSQKRAEDLNKIVLGLLDKGEDFQLYLLKYNPERSRYLEGLSDEVLIELASWAVANEEVSWAERLISARKVEDSRTLSELYSRIAVERGDYSLALSFVDGLEDEVRSDLISDIFAAMGERGDLVLFDSYVDDSVSISDDRYGQENSESVFNEKELQSEVEVDHSGSASRFEASSENFVNESRGSERPANGISLIQARGIAIESEKLRKEFGGTFGG